MFQITNQTSMILTRDDPKHYRKPDQPSLTLVKSLPFKALTHQRSSSIKM